MTSMLFAAKAAWLGYGKRRRLPLRRERALQKCADQRMQEHNQGARTGLEKSPP